MRYKTIYMWSNSYKAVYGAQLCLETKLTLEKRAMSDAQQYLHVFVEDRVMCL